MIFGNVFEGSLVSSAMFTESSNPTMAKNASEVAAVTAPNAFCPAGARMCVSCEMSPLPPVSAHKPDDDDHQQTGELDSVSTTLTLTLSPTPRGG